MSLKNIYAPAPLTTRGQPTHISLHPDGSKLAYACGRTVVIRSISNPLAADVYSEHAKNVTAVKISPRCHAGASFFAGALLFASVTAPPPSGNYCASGDETGLVKIWDITQVRPLSLKPKTRNVSRSPHTSSSSSCLHSQA